jgi:hypothetical protein
MALENKTRNSDKHHIISFLVKVCVIFIPLRRAQNENPALSAILAILG